MENPKRKSNRNFNLEKPAKRTFDLTKEQEVVKITKKPLLAYFLIGFFILLLIFGFFFFFNKKQEKNTKIENKSDTTNTEIIEVKDTIVQKIEANELKPIPYEKGVSYKVYEFPYNVSDFITTSKELDKLVEIMKENATIKISIYAYTDNVGVQKENQILSEKRAKAIADYLIKNQIESQRISYQGKGISTKYQKKSENRRAEFLLME